MKIITLCGSYKFKDEMAEVAEIMTLAGNCVLTPNELTRDSKDDYSEEEARMIDLMHKEKIRISDAILVVNVGKYIGKSTQNEIEFAKKLGKEILYLTDLMDSGDMPMTSQEIVRRWLASFGKDLAPLTIEERATSRGNHLWHLFSYDLVPHLEGDEARDAFDQEDYTEAICFHDGSCNHIEDASEIEKLYAEDIDDDDGYDIYIVAKDFSWTYVRTHHGDYCGPYFCKLE